MASPLRKQPLERARSCGAVSRAGVQLAGRGEQCGFLDLIDRPLLAAVLDPARAAAGADGDRVQTEGDGYQDRSAQRAAWHDRTSLFVFLVEMAIYGRGRRALGCR